MTDTITFAEIGLLLGLAAARDQRTVGDADTLAWHADLNAASIDYQTAEAALSRFYVDQAGTPADKRYRATSPDIIGIARKIRAERLTNYTYVPPEGDQDPQYLHRLRGQIADVASGAVPAPTTPLAITGGPHPDVTARLAAIGRYIPDHVRQELAPHRPAAAAREAAIRTGSADYLAVDCPWCKARSGQQCQRGGRPGASRARTTPHPSRVEAAEAALGHRETA
ncbi:hypothetical protein [Streptomyces sp. NRRL F-5123]|uniref:zinc finger domain-containing protein n=1 Tax=Streptomyces sp. NRRL F-5123 TaxID=1463856 RepID=UPI000693F56C|nr:hypothetical protein [Streptomyces sp. NRRL F-5123]